MRNHLDQSLFIVHNDSWITNPNVFRFTRFISCFDIVQFWVGNSFGVFCWVLVFLTDEKSCFDIRMPIYKRLDSFDACIIGITNTKIDIKIFVLLLEKRFQIILQKVIDSVIGKAKWLDDRYRGFIFKGLFEVPVKALSSKNMCWKI